MSNLQPAGCKDMETTLERFCNASKESQETPKLQIPIDKIALAKGLLDLLELDFDELDTLEDHVLNEMDRKSNDRNREPSAAPETAEAQAEAVMQSSISSLSHSHVEVQADTSGRLSLPLPPCGQLAIPNANVKTSAFPGDETFNSGLHYPANVRGLSPNNSRYPLTSHEQSYQQNHDQRRSPFPSNDTYSYTPSGNQTNWRSNIYGQQNPPLDTNPSSSVNYANGTPRPYTEPYRSVLAPIRGGYTAASHPWCMSFTQPTNDLCPTPCRDAEQPRAIPAFAGTIPFANSRPGAPFNPGRFDDDTKDPQSSGRLVASTEALTTGPQKYLGNRTYPNPSLATSTNTVDETGYTRRSWQYNPIPSTSVVQHPNNPVGYQNNGDDTPPPSKRRRLGFTSDEGPSMASKLAVTRSNSPVRGSCGGSHLATFNADETGVGGLQIVEAESETLTSQLSQDSKAAAATAPLSSADDVALETSNGKYEPKSFRAPPTTVRGERRVNSTSSINEKKQPFCSDDLYGDSDEEDEGDVQSCLRMDVVKADRSVPAYFAANSQTTPEGVDVDGKMGESKDETSDYFCSLIDSDPDSDSDASVFEDDGILAGGNGFVKAFQLIDGEFIVESQKSEDEASLRIAATLPLFRPSNGNDGHISVNETDHSLSKIEDREKIAEVFEPNVQYSFANSKRRGGQASPAYVPTSPSEPDDTEDCDADATDNGPDTRNHGKRAVGVGGYHIPPDILSPPLMAWDMNRIQLRPQQVSTGSTSPSSSSPSEGLGVPLTTQDVGIGRITEGAGPHPDFARCNSCKAVGIDRVVLHGGECQEPNQSDTSEAHKEKEKTPVRAKEALQQSPPSNNITPMAPYNPPIRHTNSTTHTPNQKKLQPPISKSPVRAPRFILSVEQAELQRDVEEKQLRQQHWAQQSMRMKTLEVTMHKLDEMEKAQDQDTMLPKGIRTQEEEAVRQVHKGQETQGKRTNGEQKKENVEEEATKNDEWSSGDETIIGVSD